MIVSERFGGVLSLGVSGSALLHVQRCSATAGHGLTVRRLWGRWLAVEPFSGTLIQGGTHVRHAHAACTHVEYMHGACKCGCLTSVKEMRMLFCYSTGRVV